MNVSELASFQCAQHFSIHAPSVIQSWRCLLQSPETTSLVVILLHAKANLLRITLCSVAAARESEVRSSSRRLASGVTSANDIASSLRQLKLAATASLSRVTAAHLTGTRQQRVVRRRNLNSDLLGRRHLLSLFEAERLVHDGQQALDASVLGVLEEVVALDLVHDAAHHLRVEHLLVLGLLGVVLVGAAIVQVA